MLQVCVAQFDNVSDLFISNKLKDDPLPTRQLPLSVKQNFTIFHKRLSPRVIRLLILGTQSSASATFLGSFRPGPTEQRFSQLLLRSLS